MIYLDSAATTLLRPVAVEQAVLNAIRTSASPGRGGHTPSMRAAETVYNCRCAAAALFNAQEPENIVFTMNATHALNMAINSFSPRGKKVVISGFEHNSVLRPLRAVGAKISIAGRKLYDSADTLDHFESALPGAELAVCTHVSNVFGYILPVERIAELCRRHGVPLIIDASQSAGVLEINAAQLGAAYIALPGHKGLMGVQGTGILVCGDAPVPLMHGGTGSDSRSELMPTYLPDAGEAGTHNVCGIAGLLAGIDYIRQKGSAKILEHEQTLREAMLKELADVPYIRVFSGDKGNQSGVLSVQCTHTDSESLASMLAERGICVRGGLHCAPCAHESAGTLDKGTVRISFSPFNSIEEVKRAAKELIACCSSENI